jgi:hypothetical protein
MTDPEEGDDAAPVKKKPSEKVKDEDEETDQPDAEDEEASEETPEEDSEEGDEEEGQDDEKSEDEDKAKKYADDSDETYVKVKIGDEEHEVKVTDLKRLYGQEASLTRKSQEVAEIRKAVEADQAKNIAAYDVMLKRSTERASQYRDLPWTQLMKDPNVPADQLAALQAEAQKAFEDEAFLKNELDGFMQKVRRISWLLARRRPVSASRPSPPPTASTTSKDGARPSTTTSARLRLTRSGSTRSW